MGYLTFVLLFICFSLQKLTAERLLVSTKNDLNMAILLNTRLQELGRGAAAQMITSAKEVANGGFFPPMPFFSPRVFHGNQVYMTPLLLSSYSQSEKRKLRWWYYTQQDYFLMHIQVGNLQPKNIPPLPMNLQDYQQLLAIHLEQMQMLLHNLTQQVGLAEAEAFPGGGATSPFYCQISYKFKLAQSIVTKINSHLSLIPYLESSAPGSLPLALLQKPYEHRFLISAIYPVENWGLFSSKSITLASVSNLTSSAVVWFSPFARVSGRPGSHTGHRIVWRGSGFGSICEKSHFWNPCSGINKMATAVFLQTRSSQLLKFSYLSPPAAAILP